MDYFQNNSYSRFKRFFKRKFVRFLARFILFAAVIFIAGCAAKLPDLTVELFDIPNSQIKGVNPSPPLIDRSTMFSVLIENDGDEVVNKSFVTKLYIDGQLVKTWTFPSQAEILDSGPEAEIVLKPGETRVYNHSTQYNEKGSHIFRWVVDADDNIRESSENNNILDITFDWQAPPDLIVEEIYPVVQAVGGQKLVWKIKVKNIGEGDAKNPFLTTFHPQVTGGAQENFWVQSLNANQSVTFSSTQWFRTWGKHQFKAKVDVGYSVPEKLPDGEDNNEYIQEFDLAYVDLKVDSFTVSPQTTLANIPLTFSISIKNIGTGDANQPFKIKVFPGIFTEAGLLQPVMLTVSRLKAGYSTILQHTVTLPPGEHDVIIEADAFDPNAVYFEPNRTNNVFHKKLTCEGMLRGRLFSQKTNISAYEMKTFINNDPRLEWFRKKVALTAIEEMAIVPTLCGDDARNRYDASGNWCSEFAAWVYRRADMKNIRYCKNHFIWCWNYVYLDEVKLTKELVNLFDRNGHRFYWRTNNQVKPQTAEVGDYVSLTTKGKKKNHSAIIVAVSQDKKLIWTAEGNVGNCLWMGGRDYFKDGVNLDISIDGIGKIDAGLF
jgi:hypothetical protein